jgi:electron transport complex protein RnfD
MINTATPLTIFKDTGEMVATGKAFLGQIPGSMGEMSALLILIGGIYIIYKRYARWRIPLSIITTVGIFALIMGDNPLFHIFTGSVMLGSFFYAVDPMTSPRFPKAQIVFGIGIALILMAMRFWGWLAEGMAFGVLIMNIFVPLLDRKFKG